MTELIKDAVQIREFKSVINLTEDLKEPKWKDKLISNYIVTKDIKRIFKEILESIVDHQCEIRDEKVLRSNLPSSSRCMHRITGGYATGKSYLLLVLSTLMACKNKEEFLRMFSESDYRDTYEIISEIGDQKYFPIRIDAASKGDVPFRTMIAEELRKALVEGGFDDIELRVEFDDAVDHLHSILDDENLRKSFEKNLTGYSNIEDMIKDLLLKNGEALEKYYRNCEKAFKRPTERYSAALERLVPDICDKVRKRGYSGGLIFYVDEITLYIRSSISKGRILDDIGEIESLDKICRARNKIWFIMAEHQDLLDVLKEGGVNPDIIKRMEGRFQYHSLAIFQREQFLKSIISPNEVVLKLAIDKGKARFEDISVLASEYGWNFLDYYPFHPATVHLLFWVSDELGQKERTSFQFIQEKFGEIKDQPVVLNGRLNLITPDVIFEYFSESLSELKSKGLNEPYSRLRKLCSNEIEEEKKVVNVLMSLYVASIAPKKDARIASSIEPKEMASYVNTSNVNLIGGILERLDRESPNIDKDAGGYYFTTEEISRLDPSVLEKEISRINFMEAFESIVSENEKEWNLCISRNYISEILKITKEFKSRILTDENLRNYVKKHRIDHEIGEVLFLLHVQDTYYFEKNLELAREVARANIVIAVPKNINMLSYGSIRKWRAIQNLLNRNKDEKYQRSLRKERERVRDDLRNSLKEFAASRNFVFVTSTGEFECENVNMTDGEPQKIIDEILNPFVEQYFDQFPNIKGFVRNRTPTNALIEEIIALKSRKIRKSGRIPEYIKEIMVPLGLVELKEKENHLEVLLKEPEDRNYKSKHVWQIIDENTASISDIYCELKKPPIGLSNELIELFLAAYVGNERAEIWDHQGKIDLSKEIMKQITEDLNAYELKKVRSLSETEKTYILNLWAEVDRLIQKDDYTRFASSKSFHEENTWKSLKKDLECFDEIIRETEGIISGLSQYVSFITGKKTRFSEIDVLGKLKMIIGGVKEIRQPIEGCVYLEKIADKLEDREFSEFDTRMSALIEAFLIPQSRHILQNLSLYLRKITELSFKRDSYLLIFEKLTDLAEFLDQTGSGLLRDVTAQEIAKEKAKGVWNAYIYYYSEEHEQANDAREDLKSSVLESMDFSLLDELSRISFPDLVRSNKIRTDLFTIVPSEVDDFNPAEKMAIHFDLHRTEILHLPDIGCPKCLYKLGEITSIKRNLEEKQKEFVETMQSAINEYFREIIEIKEEFLLYLIEKLPVDERGDPTERYKKLTELIKEYQQKGQSNKEIDEIIGLVKLLRDLIVEFLNQRGKKSAEKEILTYKRFVSEVRSKIGRKRVTIDRFEDKIVEWIEEIRKKYGKEAMIEFGDEE